MSRSERWNTVNEIKRRFHETTDPVNGAGPVVYGEKQNKHRDVPGIATAKFTVQR